MTTNQAFTKRFAQALKDNGLTVRETERQRHNSWMRGAKLYVYDSHFFIARATSKPEIMEKLKQIKDEIFNNEGPFSLAYVRGFYDSEGTHNNRKYASVGMTNCVKERLLLIQKVLSKYGITSHIYKNPDCYNLVVAARADYLRFQELIGNSSTVDLVEKTKGRRKATKTNEV